MFPAVCESIGQYALESVSDTCAVKSDICPCYGIPAPAYDNLYRDRDILVNEFGENQAQPVIHVLGYLDSFDGFFISSFVAEKLC